MPVVRGQFHQFLAPGARKVFTNDYNELPAYYPEIFNVETSSRAFEEDLVMAGMPVAVAKPEGEPIAFDRPKFRGKVRYVHTGYGLGYEITREAVEDDLYGAINNQGATNLSRSMREAEEVTAHSVLNGAFDVVTAYDGVPLISHNHPGVGGTTFSNRPDPDVDLSVAALKAAMEDFMLMRNDRGLRVNMAPSQLIVPVQNWWNANEILGAQFLSEGSQGQYTPNMTQQMGLSPYKTPYLLLPNSWYLTVPKAQHSLMFFWRRQPDPVSGTDERAGLAWWGITGRWSAGVTRWQGIYGSPGI